MKYEFIELDKASQLPAGKYYVIDPCYVFGEDEEFWSDFCAFCFPSDEKHRNQFFVRSNGQLWYIWSTAYGDGAYPVMEGRHCIGYAGVDAGCLAIIPENLIHKGQEELGVKIEILYPVDPATDEDGWTGDIEFGQFKVLTCDVPEPEEEYAE